MNRFKRCLKVLRDYSRVSALALAVFVSGEPCPAWAGETGNSGGILDATGAAACIKEIARAQEKIPPFRVRYRLIEQSAGGSAKTFDCEFSCRSGPFSFARSSPDGKVLTQVNFDGKRYYRYESQFEHGIVTPDNPLNLEDHSFAGFFAWLGPISLASFLDASADGPPAVTRLEDRCAAFEPGRCSRSVEIFRSKDVVEATETVAVVSEDGGSEEVARRVHLVLDPNRDYSLASAVIEWGTPLLNNGFLYRYRRYELAVTAWHEVRGFSLPCRARIRLDESSRWGGKEVNITLAAAPEDFSAFDVPAGFAMKFPPGTRVADRIMNTSYVISQFASQ
jgi:hypothetical protein